MLNFANSSTIPWTGALSITNWTGSPAGGGLDQVHFGIDGTGLTVNQLALIQFVNPDGFAPGSYAAQILATGELVIVPEPVAFVSLFGGVGVLLSLRCFRRKS